MCPAQVLLNFQNEVIQCNSLIANAHKLDSAGTPLFPAKDKEQITVAAFLNMFIAWEAFLESSLAKFMTGSATINGTLPVRYVMPPTIESAHALVIGTMRYFDYGNHFNVRKMVNLYFKDGYPYEQPLAATYSVLDDLRAMRNSSAHISSTTQTALESLALRIFGKSYAGVTLYQLLITTDPNSQAGSTVFASYKEKLLTTAELIAKG